MRNRKDKPFSNDIDETLIRIIKCDHPETLENAIEIARTRLADCGESIADHVLRLESQGRVLFEKPASTVPSSLTKFLLSGWAWWFWVVFGSALTSAVMVFVIPKDAFPAANARYMLGSVLVLFLPGYSLVRALFGDRRLDKIERIAMSIGLSLALASLVGLLLNYSYWGIRTNLVTLLLLVLILIFASVAVVRDYMRARH